MAVLKRKKILWTLLIIISFLGALVIFNFARLQNNGDDVWFLANSNSPLLDYLQMRYYTWSGRLPAETLIVVMLRLPIIYWKLLGTFCLVIMGVAVSRIVHSFYYKEKHLSSPILYGMMFFLPFFVWLFSDLKCKSFFAPDFTCSVTSTGLFWYTGFFVYFLPFTCVFLMIALFLEMQKSRKKWVYAIFIIILGVYATCIEQSALFWLVFCSFQFFEYCFQFFRNKGKHFGQFISSFIKTPEFIIYIVTGTFTLFYLLAPGNKNRLALETANWMPEFSSFSIGEKLQIGFGYSLEMITSHLLVLFLLIFICCICIFQFTQDKKGMVISSIGAFLSLILSAVFFLGRTQQKSYVFLLNSSEKGANIQWNYITLCTVSIIFVLFIAVILRAFEERRQKKDVMMLLIVSWLSSSAIGFSPTIYASGARTQYLSFMLYTLLFLILLVRLYLIVKSKYKIVKI